MLMERMTDDEQKQNYTVHFVDGRIGTKSTIYIFSIHVIVPGYLNMFGQDHPIKVITAFYASKTWLNWVIYTTLDRGLDIHILQAFRIEVMFKKSLTIST